MRLVRIEKTSMTTAGDIITVSKVAYLTATYDIKQNVVYMYRKIYASTLNSQRTSTL